MTSILIFFILIVGTHGISLIKNGDFESGSDGWTFNHCSGNVDHGNLHITHRTASWAGPYQMLNTDLVNQVESPLMLSAQVKPIEDAIFRIKLRSSKNGTDHYDTLLSSSIKAGEWANLYSSVSFSSNALGADSLRFYAETDKSTTDYRMDNVVFEEQDQSWKEEADARIDALRKSNVAVRLEGPTSADLIMEVTQLTHAFPFGTAVQSTEISDCQVMGEDSAFCKFTRENYNWVVDTYRMKWRAMEPHQGDMVTEIPDNMCAWAKKNGLTVRGHSILWAKEKNNPSWLQDMEGQEFADAVLNRVETALRWSENLTSDWDVINEMVDQPEGEHNYYLDKSGDPDIRRKIFQRAKDLSPNTRFFVNDYGIIMDNYGRFDSYRQLIRDLLDQGAPIDGIGLQSHLQAKTVDPAGFKMRVEALAEEFGLPIWITEFDWNSSGTVDDPEHILHAVQVEDFYRLMFSLEPIKGIVMWGFKKDFGSLVDDNIVPNLAGETYTRLYHDEWRTNLVLDGSGGDFDFRGFDGDYAISILNGEGVLVENFEFSVIEDTNVVCVNDDGPWNCSVI